MTRAEFVTWERPVIWSHLDELAESVSETLALHKQLPFI